jgi:hypothetical protein
MRQPAVSLLTATLLGAAATQRANLAHQTLSDRYTAIWSTLDTAQKVRFSAQERAWLNEGRQREREACIARLGKPSEALARACDAEVIERHLGALAAPQRVAATR